ncbi:hypothetical protein Sa4125_35210 [Aureimonas sp. SA4125]|uniref:DUF2147 domain-containing protein n=1 Tax=Aureimonas sp. SA4125 TaxID=2826993 RepID=UPI001CC46D9B|nr:DUF2147 domain-containing protein [Aureimonas sp. SA4125]BDA85979.1 hypothetical protein Sa4125_35210 [Aureimonas sp. SA4125]
MRPILAAFLILSTASTALADEPILGKWRAPGGGIVEVTSCSAGFCATVISGQHKGKDAGAMNGSDGVYAGSVTDPRDDKTYQGEAVIEGDVLKMTGCVLKVLCKTQRWTRV